MMEIMSFVGFSRYYSHFVKNFTSNAIHSANLTKKEVPFEGSKKCEENFQKLKILFTTTPFSHYRLRVTTLLSIAMLYILDRVMW